MTDNSLRIDQYTQTEILAALYQVGVTELMISELPKQVAPQHHFLSGRSISYEATQEYWFVLRSLFQELHGFQLADCPLRADNRQPKPPSRVYKFAVMAITAILTLIGCILIHIKTSPNPIQPSLLTRTIILNVPAEKPQHNLLNDPLNCGNIGMVCTAGQNCVQGYCEINRNGVTDAITGGAYNCANDPKLGKPCGNGGTLICTSDARGLICKDGGN